MSLPGASADEVVQISKDTRDPNYPECGKSLRRAGLDLSFLRAAVKTDINISHIDYFFEETCWYLCLTPGKHLMLLQTPTAGFDLPSTLRM